MMGHLRRIVRRARGEAEILAVLGKRIHKRHAVFGPEENGDLLMASGILEAVFKFLTGCLEHVLNRTPK